MATKFRKGDVVEAAGLVGKGELVVWGINSFGYPIFKDVIDPFHPDHVRLLRRPPWINDVLKRSDGLTARVLSVTDSNVTMDWTDRPGDGRWMGPPIHLLREGWLHEDGTTIEIGRISLEEKAELLSLRELRDRASKELTLTTTPKTRRSGQDFQMQIEASEILEELSHFTRKLSPRGRLLAACSAALSATFMVETPAGAELRKRVNDALAKNGQEVFVTKQRTSMLDPDRHASRPQKRHTAAADKAASLLARAIFFRRKETIELADLRSEALASQRILSASSDGAKGKAKAWLEVREEFLSILRKLWRRDHEGWASAARKEARELVDVLEGSSWVSEEEEEPATVIVNEGVTLALENVVDKEPRILSVGDRVRSVKLMYCHIPCFAGEGEVLEIEQSGPGRICARVQPVDLRHVPDWYWIGYLQHADGAPIDDEAYKTGMNGGAS